MSVRNPAKFSARRIEQGISQNELARQLQRSQSFISCVARGLTRVDDADARAISVLLGYTSTAALFEKAAPSLARRKFHDELIRKHGAKPASE